MPEQYTMSNPGIPEVRATPPKYPLALSASEAVSAIHDFVSKPFGLDNPPGRMLGDFLALPDVAKTLERVGYGERLTTGQGWNLHIGDETLGAIGALPFGLPGKAGKAGKLANFGEKTATEALNPEIKLLHSSPHKFDEFDSASHMGKGEGAQVYGQGSYLTDSPGVHKYYNRAMASRVQDDSDEWMNLIHNGKRMSRNEYYDLTSKSQKDPEAAALWRYNFNDGDFNRALAEIKQQRRQADKVLGDPNTTPSVRERALKDAKLNKGAEEWLIKNKHHLEWADSKGDVVFKGQKWEPDPWYTADGETHTRVLRDLHDIRDSSDPVRTLKGMLDNDIHHIEESIKNTPDLTRRAHGGNLKPGDLEAQIEESLEYHRRTLEKSKAEKQWLEDNEHLIQVDKSKVPERKRAQRYEVEFPDKHVDKLLQYDKPYSEQTPYVQRRLQKALDKDHETLLKSNQTGSSLYERASLMTAKDIKKGGVYDAYTHRGTRQITVKDVDPKGQWVEHTDPDTSETILSSPEYFLGLLESNRDDLKAASKMYEAGIPGHKYSAAAGGRRTNRDSQHHNYVIYPEADKKHLKITKREDVGND